MRFVLVVDVAVFLGGNRAITSCVCADAADAGVGFSAIGGRGFQKAEGDPMASNRTTHRDHDCPSICTASHIAGSGAGDGSNATAGANDNRLHHAGRALRESEGGQDNRRRRPWKECGMAARGVSTTRRFSSLGTEPRSCVPWRTPAQPGGEPRVYRGSGQVPLALTSTRRAASPDPSCPSRIPGAVSGGDLLGGFRAARFALAGAVLVLAPAVVSDAHVQELAPASPGMRAL